MPSYDYRCQECREQFSVERSMTEDASGTVCEHCGSAEVSRIWNMYIRASGAALEPSQGGGCGSCCSSSCGSCGC